MAKVIYRVTVSVFGCPGYLVLHARDEPVPRTSLEASPICFLLCFLESRGRLRQGERIADDEVGFVEDP